MNRNWNSFIFLINFLLLIAGLFVYYFNLPDFDKDFIFVILLLTTLMTFIFLIRYENNDALRGNFFKHSNLVLIGLLVVNFQKYLDYYLDYITRSELLLQVSQLTGVKTLLLSFIGLICFFMGYLLKSSKNSVRYSNDFGKQVKTFLLSFISTVFLIGFLLTVNPAYVFGGYGIYDMGVTAIYFSVLFKAGFFALAIQKIINLKILSQKSVGFFKFLLEMGWFNLCILLVYLTVVLLSGDRGDIITFSLLLLSGYMLVTGKKFKMIKSVFLIIIASTFITLLGIARSFNVENNFSFTEKIVKAINGDSNIVQPTSVLPATSELADSVKALQYSIEYVPSIYDYFYGKFQLGAIFSVFPFSSSINELVFSDNSSKTTSSDSYVTWLIEGDNAMSGEGTSILADFYLSYGVYGIIIGMMFFGWLVKYCEQRTSFQNDKYLIGLIISVVIFCTSIYLARSSLFSLIRLIIWIWIFIKINEWSLRSLKRAA